MSLNRIIALVTFSLLFSLYSCKKEQIEISNLNGNWVEDTTNLDKVELEILSDGTLYTSYVDTLNTNIVDTGYVIIKEGDAIEFYFSWGTKGGHLNLESNELQINDFRMDVFPTVTNFDRK